MEQKQVKLTFSRTAWKPNAQPGRTCRDSEPPTDRLELAPARGSPWGSLVSACESVFYAVLRDPWPDGGDAFMLANILHDWPAATCRRLLRSCHDALPSDGKIFVQEILLDEEKVSPGVAVAFDLMMCLNHGSQQFTAGELFGLLEEADFVDPAIVHRFGYYSLATARKR